MALPHDRFESRAVENVVRGRGAADGDVHLLELRGPVSTQRHHAASQFRREGLGALRGSQLAKMTPRAPRGIRARAVFSLVSPAPITRTSCSASELKIFSASSTATEAMEMLPRWMLVSVRMCLTE